MTQTLPQNKEAPPQKKRASPQEKQALPQDKQALPRTKQALSRRNDDLHAEHDALLQRYAEVHQEWSSQEAMVHSIRGDVESGPGDDADHAAMRGSLDEEVARAEELRHQLDDVQDALDRVAAGTYGKCERCGKQIPAERLELFPATTLCVDCKKLAER